MLRLLDSEGGTALRPSLEVGAVEWPTAGEKNVY